MTDQELADKVVSLGVGLSCAGIYSDCYSIANSSPINAFSFVRDWRVAGALMEKVNNIDTKPLISIEDSTVDINDVYSDISAEVENKSLRRAIIEACVEALS